MPKLKHCGRRAEDRASPRPTKGRAATAYADALALAALETGPVAKVAALRTDPGGGLAAALASFGASKSKSASVKHPVRQTGPSRHLPKCKPPSVSARIAAS
jgi:hypothetical protein